MEEYGYYCDLTGEAAALYKKAEQGDPESQYFFGRYILFEPDGSYRKDLNTEEIERALRYLEQAAMQGVMDGGAAMDIAELYFKGVIVPRDYHRARLWYQTASLKNNPVAACSLGDFAFDGYDCEVNYEEAAIWYIRALPKFHDAAYRLGDMFRGGKYFDRDEEIAGKLYEYVLRCEKKIYEKNGFYSDARAEVMRRLEQELTDDDYQSADVSRDTETKKRLRDEILAIIDPSDDRPVV